MRLRILCVAILLLNSHLLAENASVRYLIGEVRVKQVSQQLGWSALQMQTALHEKDIIRTGEEARCDIELPDGSVTKVLEKSVLELRNFPDPSEDKMDLFTGLGSFFFQVKKALSRKFQVSSPVAVVAIRGTQFMVVNDGDKSRILVREGKVDLSDVYMRSTVSVQAGFKSHVTSGGLPSQPAPLTDAEKALLEKLAASETGPQTPQKSFDTPQPAPQAKPGKKTMRSNDTIVPQSEKPQQDVSAGPPQNSGPGKSADSGDSGGDESSGGGSTGLTTGVTVGAVTLDDKLYNQIGLRPEFSIGKLGVALDLSIYIDSDGNISDENWNSFSDIIEKIYYVRWGHRNDPLYVRVGAIDNYRLGFGLLMNHYANTVEYPDVIRTGVEFGLKTDSYGVDAMLNNVGELLNGGGLMGVRYSQNVMGSLQVGASVVYDRNQFKGLKDRDDDGVPDYLDAFPDNKNQSLDSDGDGIPDAQDFDRDGNGFTDNEELLIEQGMDVGLINDQNYLDDKENWADNYLDPKPFDTNKADGKTQVALALDVSYPLLTFDYLKLVAYGQYANYPKNDGAWGITAPGFLAKFAFINAYAEYRVFSSGFLPEYFNRTYELERATFVGDSIVTKADRLDEIKESLQGFVIGADFNLFDFLIFGAEYQNMTSVNYDLRTFRSTLDLNTSFIPRINRAGAYYMQDNARKLFRKTEGTILGYRLEYEIAGGASLLLDFRQTYRDLNGDGKLEPMKSTTIQTVMRF